jgi:hypothetical protein
MIFIPIEGPGYGIFLSHFFIFIFAALYHPVLWGERKIQKLPFNHWQSYLLFLGRTKIYLRSLSLFGDRLVFGEQNFHCPHAAKENLAGFIGFYKCGFAPVF